MSGNDVEADRIPSGRHKGQLVTRVPVALLHWMVRDNQPGAGLALAELVRRGVTLPKMDISGHAIDRASQRLWRIWRKMRVEDEGLHHWLRRAALAAWNSRDPAKPLPEILTRDGIRFVFEVTGNWPTLKTVTKERRG